VDSCGLPREMAKMRGLSRRSAAINVVPQLAGEADAVRILGQAHLTAIKQ
jgi:hypothetical protein